jgi:demethylmenaquinone methyltransferase / 2-methoxy-6-polyprenyl-1,4-benzoquinol methylase
MSQVTPYNNDRAKKEQVAEMFNNIAFRYDFLNSLLSLGIHKGWRRKAISIFRHKKPRLILDVATGTADFAIEALKAQPEKVVGVDISAGMLEVGRKKIRKAGLENRIELQLVDAEGLPFPDNHFDAITVAFGVRNFEHLEKGLREMQRVLKPGGDLVVIEFSKPRGWFSYLYKFYFKYITPAIGRLFSKDHRAYSYLPESVEAFPYGEKFCNILHACGFSKESYKPLTFGVACIYHATK